MNIKAYQHGFNSVCTRLGVDPAGIAKSAAELPTMQEQTQGSRVLHGAGKGALIGAGLGGTAGLAITAALVLKLLHAKGPDAWLGRALSPAVGVLGAGMYGGGGAALGGLGGTVIGGVGGGAMKPSLKDRARGVLGSASQALA